MTWRESYIPRVPSVSIIVPTWVVCPVQMRTRCRFSPVWYDGVLAHRSRFTWIAAANRRDFSWTRVKEELGFSAARLSRIGPSSRWRTPTISWASPNPARSQRSRRRFEDSPRRLIQTWSVRRRIHLLRFVSFRFSLLMRYMEASVVKCLMNDMVVKVQALEM